MFAAFRLGACTLELSRRSCCVAADARCRQRVVVNFCAQPSGGTGVTGVTRQCGRNMQPRRFALGRRNNPMTIRTRCTGGLQVIDFGHRLPGGNDMARLAQVGGGRMATGQAARFALCQHAVVTSRTDLNAGLGVVKFEDRFPLTGILVMTGVAHVAGRQSRQMLALHDADVRKAGGTVATGAIAVKSGVVNRRRLPSRNEVAGITRLRGRHVGGRILTRRERAVVAGRAHRNAGFGMIKLGDRLPYVWERLMAFLAEVAGDQASSVLALGRFAAGFDAVVASDASANDCTVVDCGWFPSRNFVTVITLSYRDDVGSRLTVKSDLACAIVTGLASSNCLRVQGRIIRRDIRPAPFRSTYTWSIDMTCLANICRWHVGS